MLNQINKPFAIYSLSSINLGAKQARNTRGATNSLRTIDHEEWRVVGGLARGHPQSPEHHGKLCDKSSTKLVQPFEDPRLEAL